MSKFYVKCGPIQTILNANSVEQAALSALDQVLQSHLWIFDDPGLSEQDRRDKVLALLCSSQDARDRCLGREAASGCGHAQGHRSARQYRCTDRAAVRCGR